MRKIENAYISQLYIQLRFTPAGKRQKQLENAEKLFCQIESDKTYPFDFVCYRITGFMPKTEHGAILCDGAELREDMRIFINKLSGQLAVPVSEVKEKVYAPAELANELGVSTKTLDRWRKEGLCARKFYFDQGRSRIGFLESAVKHFKASHGMKVKRASGFKRLDNSERKNIIRQAANLASKGFRSRYSVIEDIAQNIGVAHETVRYTLLDYERKNPKKVIFSRPSGVLSAKDSAEIYKLYKQGVGVTELAKRYFRSKSSIYRTIKTRRAKAILTIKIEFIMSDEFLKPDAFSRILGSPVDLSPMSLMTDIKSPKVATRSLTQYLDMLRSVKPLNRTREVDLFRRYNYLKYMAFVDRSAMKATKPLSSDICRIERYLEEIDRLKTALIEANLRLVVIIANKHTRQAGLLGDMVSEGNLSLMRAVEKFDYTKGYRFATYASWVIAKDFARIIPAETYRADKAGSFEIDELDHDLRVAAAGVVDIEQTQRDLAHMIKDNLDEREEYVILHHFGLLGSSIRKNRKTLKQIGLDLGLSKERVRQIELIALQKLRQVLSMEQFELLTA